MLWLRYHTPIVGIVPGSGSAEGKPPNKRRTKCEQWKKETVRLKLTPQKRPDDAETNPICDKVVQKIVGSCRLGSSVIVVEGDDDGVREA